jgi:hypothetical protein
MSVNAADFYSTAQNQSTAEAKRAAEVRKRLLKGAAEIEGSATPEESLLIGQWMSAVRSQALTGEQNRARSSGKDLEFG